MTRLRPQIAFLLTLVLVSGLLGMAPTRAQEGDGRCGTRPADGDPTLGLGNNHLWANEDGVAVERPEDGMYARVGLSEGRVDAQLRPDGSTQVSFAEDRWCLMIRGAPLGDVHGEFEGAEGIQDPVPLPRLQRSGRQWIAPDGRRTILYGVDYPFNTTGGDVTPFDLADEDFDRIRSWGMNLLRIRLRDYRAGYFPGRPEPESGYLEKLDQIIAGANTRGIYVIIATGGPDTLAMGRLQSVGDPLHEQLKFIPGTEAHEHWIAYLGSIFDRYAHWPGVVGFDPINEDISYPPGTHDQFFMEGAHRAAVSRLRQTSSESVYLQQPSGWDYWNLSVAVGHDIEDDNRNFCMKWSANAQQGTAGSHEARVEEMVQWAEHAGTSLFICEYVIYDNPNNPEETMLDLQRYAIHAMDKYLVGSARNLYGNGHAGGLLTEDRSEAFWVRELVRPYPAWIGGEPTSISWDFDERRLDLGLDLDGTGPTEVFVSPERIYPMGFVATTSGGGTLVHDGLDVVTATGLSWDGDGRRLILSSAVGAEVLTILPRL